MTAEEKWQDQKEHARKFLRPMYDQDVHFKPNSYGEDLAISAMVKYARLKSQEDTRELVEALIEVSPLLDGLINRTPTGKQREELCDMNIKVKSALAAHTPKG